MDDPDPGHPFLKLLHFDPYGLLQSLDVPTISCTKARLSESPLDLASFWIERKIGDAIKHINFLPLIHQLSDQGFESDRIQAPVTPVSADDDGFDLTVPGQLLKNSIELATIQIGSVGLRKIDNVPRFHHFGESGKQMLGMTIAD